MDKLELFEKKIKVMNKLTLSHEMTATIEILWSNHYETMQWFKDCN